MLKKIAIALLVLLMIQIALYVPTVFGTETEKPANPAGNSVIIEAQNAESLIIVMGINTKVNEEELEKKYPSAKVSMNPENGNAIINFSNAEQNSYRLDVFDVNKGLVASYINVNSGEVEINKDMYNAGAYIYKLVGESNTFCGTFMLR